MPANLWAFFLPFMARNNFIYLIKLLKLELPQKVSTRLPKKW